jgi:hypothetical protein
MCTVGTFPTILFFSFLFLETSITAAVVFGVVGGVDHCDKKTNYFFFLLDAIDRLCKQEMEHPRFAVSHSRG